MASAGTPAAPGTAGTPARRGVSGHALKLLAIFGMAADHVGLAFQPVLPFPLACALEALGGLTFPIMSFLLVEGFHHTSSVRRYGMRLMVFALVSQAPFSLAFPPEEIALGQTQLTPPITGNVLFTLALGLFLLWADRSMRCRLGFWALAAACVTASAVLDWGVKGPLMIVCMGRLDTRRARVAVAWAVPALGLGLPALSALMAGDLSALPATLYALAGCSAAAAALLGYDGTRGRQSRWLFYVFYPTHLALIALVAHAVLP